MSGRRSRYNQISITRIPTRKRTIQLAGSQEYDGKWYRCWYCGFPGNNIDRNAIGDGDGLVYDEDSAGQGNELFTGGPEPSMGDQGEVVLQSNDPLDSNTAFLARSVSGCSFCGSKNYR